MTPRVRPRYAASAIATIGTWNRLAVATHSVFEP